jgi:hypothetical protein
VDGEIRTFLQSGLNLNGSVIFKSADKALNSAGFPPIAVVKNSPRKKEKKGVDPGIVARACVCTCL